MEEFRVQLIRPVTAVLKRAASILEMKPEKAFEYLVRNMLPPYPNLVEGGYIRLFHEKKLTMTFHLPKRDSALDRLAAKLRAKGNPVWMPKSNTHTVAISAELKAQVAATAKQLEIDDTELYNRLVWAGSDLVAHFQHGGTAYAFSKKNELFGVVEFKP